MVTSENRRRTSGLGVRREIGQGDSKETKPSVPRRKRKKRSFSLTLRRMLLRSRTWKLPSTTFILLITIVVALLVWGSKFMDHPSGPSLTGSSADFQRRYKERNELVQQYTEVYDATYKLSSERLLPPEQTIWPEYERRPYELKSTYGSSIKTCEITILITDPRLAFPTYLGGPGQPIWFALESIGAFAPHACVLLQTTTCAMEEYLGEESTREEALQEIQQSVYDNSLPLFRRMIEAGHVRLTTIDHDKYNLMGCTNFGNPTPAFVNRWFWEDEFLDGIDSDLVIVFQSDAALCYPLEITGLTEYAIVGGVWPRKATPLTPDPMEGSCLGMPSRWKNWLLPQRRWETQQANKKNIAGKQRPAPEPREKLPEDFPPVCEGGRGPLANGGFSLRSRKWMIRAIKTCPHVANSGLNLTEEPLACKVFEQVNEDFYFGTILAGINAPLPSAYTASLFATEMLWPEQVWEMYELPQDAERDLRGSVVTGRPFVWLDSQKLTIPNGVHKPWWYHSNEVIRSPEVARGCQFLQYIFTPEMSRWEDLNKDIKPWVGIGS